MAGYPFRRNDLTVEEWEDLGRVEEFMQARNRNEQMQMMGTIGMRK